jgi:hypothetical protein
MALGCPNEPAATPSEMDLINWFPVLNQLMCVKNCIDLILV